MRFSNRPVFRKKILPWYDTGPLCAIFLLLVVCLFTFSLVGVMVAKENPEYTSFIWLPMLLSIMSGAVMISLVTRIIKRFFGS